MGNHVVLLTLFGHRALFYSKTFRNYWLPARNRRFEEWPPDLGSSKTLKQGFVVMAANSCRHTAWWHTLHLLAQFLPTWTPSAEKHHLCFYSGHKTFVYTDVILHENWGQS